MSQHRPFHYRSLEELAAAAGELGVTLRFEHNFSPLAARVRLGRRTAPNALAVLPMEGCDSRADGGPGELVERRYLRFAGGGAGLLWWEACAVVPEGRANPLQMMLTDGNRDAFARLLAKANAEAARLNGAGHRPLHVLQLTHSGRYCRPVSSPAPIIPQHDPLLDPRAGIPPDSPVVSDAYLDGLVERYVHSARLAYRSGFDGVDIKACHRYLLSELLASHTRPGKYGGSFDNRSRLLLDIVRAVRAELGPDFIVACRFNVFDAHPLPYGFGADRRDEMTWDPTEPLELARALCKAGAGLLSNSAGNPYYVYPQVTRPFDQSSQGVPVPREHPLESVARLFDFTARIQAAAGTVPVAGNGYTWLRQFLPYAGAANLAAGRCAFVGLGRSSFAYPGAPRDILAGGMNPSMCCVTCSKCTQMMRDRGVTGCVVRDAEVYAPLYKTQRAAAQAAAQGRNA